MSVNRYLANQVWSFREKLSTGLGPDRVTISAQLVKLKDEYEEVREAILNRAPREEIAAELADVVVVCCMAAAALDVDAEDLLELVRDKMEINLRREWYATASGTARHTPEA